MHCWNFHWKNIIDKKKILFPSIHTLNATYSSNCRQRQPSIYNVQWISCLLSGVIYFHYISDDQFMVNTTQAVLCSFCMRTVRIPFVRRIIRIIRSDNTHKVYFCMSFVRCFEQSAHINTIRVLLGSQHNANNKNSI